MWIGKSVAVGGGFNGGLGNTYFMGAGEVEAGIINLHDIFRWGMLGEGRGVPKQIFFPRWGMG